MKKKSFGAKIIVAILALAMIISCGIPGIGDAITAQAAGTTMTAKEIVADMGVGWNLGNALDAHNGGRGNSSETSWGNPTITKELITTVKNKGFNTVRVPVTWYEHVTKKTVNGKTEYVIDSAWMNRVEEVVKYAYDQDMYVILNIHHEEGRINRSDLESAYGDMSEYVVSLWTQIATRFANYDQHLIFEGMNEPRAVGTLEEWWTESGAKFDVINKLNADFARTVRSIESPYKNTRLLMVPSYAASIDKAMYDKIVIPNTGLDSNRDGRDDYIAASIHAYRPYDFTMGGGDHSSFSTEYNSMLMEDFTRVCDAYVKKGIQVVFGEFSASNYGYDNARIAWATAYMSYAKECGIPCVLWDNNKESNNGGESHGYVNRSNNTWYSSGEKVVDTLIGVYNDEDILWRSYADNNLGLKVSSKSFTSGGPGTNPGGGESGGNDEPGTGPAPTRNHEQLTNDKKLQEDSSYSTDYWAFKENAYLFVKGTELAVKYYSSVPSIELYTTGWENWTKVEADDIDGINKIAYFSYDKVMEAWGTSKGELVYVKVVPFDKNNKCYLLNIMSGSPSSPDPGEHTGITNPVIKAFSFTVSGDMGINFFMEVPDNAARVTLSGPSGDINKNLTDADKSGELKVSYTVAAKDIGKDITVAVYTSDGQQIGFSNTENVSGGSYKISVSKALDILMNSSTSSSELVALAKSMYNYGAVSAAYFGADTSWVKLAGSQNVYSLVGSLDSAALNSYAESIRGTLPSDVTYVGASLILEENVTVRHYFKGNVWSQSFKVNGVQKTIKQVSGASDLYYIDVEDINVVDFDTAYTLSVEGWSCKYSVMAYGKNALGGGSEGIKAVVAAMYDYMKKAESYFSKN